MLKFIGSGSAFNTKLGNTSAYIKENNTLLLIDCGELTFNRILELNLLDDVEEVHIVLTHTHPDHVGSLGSFIFFCFYAKQIRPIFHAATTNFIQLLEMMGVTNKHCEFDNCTFRPDIFISSLNIELGFTLVDHSKELPSFAIFLGNRNISEILYYSGDSKDIDKNVIHALKSGRIGYIYQDTSKADYDDSVHLSLRKLCELIPENLRNKVYCMHLDNGFIPEEARGLGFNVVENEGVNK